MSDEQRRLLHLIESTFAGIELGDGVSLRQTVVLDDYGGKEELEAARALDELLDWRKIVDDPELTRHVSFGGLSFYDAKGLCFHLPAYLSLAVKDPDQGVVANLVFTLSDLDQLDGYNRQRLAPLTGRQCACVREVLLYLRTFWDSGVTFDLDQAIECYWPPEPPDRQ